LLDETSDRTDQSSTSCGHHHVIEVDLFLLFKHFFGHGGVPCHDRVIFEGMNEPDAFLFGEFSGFLDAFFIIRANLVNLYKSLALLLNEFKLVWEARLRYKNVVFD
jgi:hypothetical protein